uniref:Uncharacterized protein n=1 Tax=Rangifer tarandus platyrhynchus TaxID=3082113 RepID=A0ACB0EGU6_RANTA|nr:unnamed protein product [Rangifer tarandus platyrhynchus]
MQTRPESVGAPPGGLAALLRTTGPLHSLSLETTSDIIQCRSPFSQNTARSSSTGRRALTSISLTCRDQVHGCGPGTMLGMENTAVSRTSALPPSLWSPESSARDRSYPVTSVKTAPATYTTWRVDTL